MSLARAISRGERLNARLGVNGTQKAARSFGTVAATSRVSASDMGVPPWIEWGVGDRLADNGCARNRRALIPGMRADGESGHAPAGRIEPIGSRLRPTSPRPQSLTGTTNGG